MLDEPNYDNDGELVNLTDLCLYIDHIVVLLYLYCVITDIGSVLVIIDEVHVLCWVNLTMIMMVN